MNFNLKIDWSLFMSSSVIRTLSIFTSHPPLQPVVNVELDRLREREKALQAENLRLREEKLELQAAAEVGQSEVPLLKERVAELQKYTELLKVEKAALEGHTDRSLASTTSSIGNLRRVSPVLILFPCVPCVTA